MADIEGTIFMSNDARNYLNSDWPKIVVKNYLEDGLSHIGLTHDITISYDHSFAPHDTCAHDNYDSSEYDSGLHCAWADFADWVNGHPDEAADINECLLLDGNYDGPGGLGLCSNSVAVSKGAEYINNVSYSFPRYHTGYAYSWTKVAVHEAGHCLSGSHGDGLTYAAPNVDPSSCYITPMSPDYDENTQNNCGTATEDWDWYSNDYNDQYFWDDCTGAKINNYAQNGC